MTFSLPAATFAGLLILLGNWFFFLKSKLMKRKEIIHWNELCPTDTGFITLNRYILLDPPLLFFISASVYTVVKFHNQRHWYDSMNFGFYFVFLFIDGLNDCDAGPSPLLGGSGFLRTDWCWLRQSVSNLSDCSLCPLSVFEWSLICGTFWETYLARW